MQNKMDRTAGQSAQAAGWTTVDGVPALERHVSHVRLTVNRMQRLPRNQAEKIKSQKVAAGHAACWMSEGKMCAGIATTAFPSVRMFQVLLPAIYKQQ